MYSFEKKIEFKKFVGKKLGYPVVIKPINEGSSVNVFICNKMNLIKKLKI